MQELAMSPNEDVKCSSSNVSLPSPQSLSSASSSSQSDESELTVGSTDVACDYLELHGRLSLDHVVERVDDTSTVHSKSDIVNKLLNQTPMYDEKAPCLVSLIPMLAVKATRELYPQSKFYQPLSASLIEELSNSNSLVKNNNKSTARNVSNRGGSGSIDGDRNGDFSCSDEGDDEDEGEDEDSDETRSTLSGSDAEYAELLKEMPILMGVDDILPSSKVVSSSLSDSQDPDTMILQNTSEEVVLRATERPASIPVVTPVHQMTYVPTMPTNDDETDGDSLATDVVHGNIPVDLLEEDDDDDIGDGSCTSYESSNFSESNTEDGVDADRLRDLSVQVPQTVRPILNEHHIPVESTGIQRPDDCSTMVLLASSMQRVAQQSRAVPESLFGQEKNATVGDLECTDTVMQDCTIDSSYCSSSYMSDSSYGSSDDDGEGDVLKEMVTSTLRNDQNGAKTGDVSFPQKQLSCGASVASSSSGFRSSTDDDDDDDSSYDSDYDELMDEMPIALGSPRKRLRPLVAEPVAPSSAKKEEYPSPPPELMNPMEGLAMFASIRADLEKVGRMIVAKKDGEKFLRRAHILASINWLAASVPTCVLDHLGQEIRQTLEEKKGRKSEGNCVDLIDVPDDASEASALSLSECQFEGDEEGNRESQTNGGLHVKASRRVSYVAAIEKTDQTSKKPSSLPFVSYFEGALLFVDISGFTKLSTMTDPENLSKIINSYFQQLVDVIFAHGGDIQKYAGDAVFAEWRASPTSSLEECVTAAAACSMEMVKECANINVSTLAGKFNARSSSHSLNVHCGLGVGRLAGFHVGDNTHRREYLYLGDPIIQATEACNKAALGEVVASQQFQEILVQLGHIKNATSSHIVLASRDVMNINFRKDAYAIKPRNAKSRGITDHVDGLHVDALIEYRRLMSLYVHPVLVSDDVAASSDFKSSLRAGADQDCRREDAELRSVYVVFINPLVDLHLTGNAEHDRTCVELVNSIMGIVTRELNQHSGHLRQCIVDDKGLVLIGTFGLRGSTFPNMVSGRALPATFAISQALQMELGVKSKIGATFGDVYCGPVGGESRHEYSVMGPSCNLAARLMSSSKNPGILVDNAVCKIASRSFCFNALDPVVAKGYKDPVPIFEPLTSREHTWGRIEANFVGRRCEILKLASMANEMMRSDCSAARVAIISSSSGVGKSTLLAHSIEHIKRALGRRRGLIIAKHAGREADAVVPFSTIRSILLSLIISFTAATDDQSLKSGFNSARSTIRSLGYDSLSACTAAESPALSKSQTLSALEDICHELNPPACMVDHLKYHLLGIEVDVGDNKMTPSLRSIADYVARILARCCEESSLTLIAIDDINRADAYSWQVIQHIFARTNNVLVIGTSHTSADLSMRINKDFWATLSDTHQSQGRFVEIEIDRLSEEEIMWMTMKTMALPRQDVEGSEMLHEVFVQSGGTPLFANKILEGIKHRLAVCAPLGSEGDDAISEIVLHRVDSFDVAVRSTLNVAAVIGHSFSLDELVSVFTGTNDSKDTDIRTQTVDTLQFLVTEGILYCCEKETRTGLKHVPLVDDSATHFTFYQEIWCSTVLRLMLDSRKREIHRKIAASMEASVGNKPHSTDFIQKVFGHWKGAEDALKMASVALKMGAYALQDVEMQSETIRMIEETLKMWNFAAIDAIGGFPSEVLQFVSPNELSQILALVVLKGRLLSLCDQPKASARSFERALRIKHASPAYNLIADTSVIFPAYAGLCEAIANGHFEQDAQRQYEQTLVDDFVETTQSHALTIHHIHARYLQMDLATQLGDKGKALTAHNIIKRTYKPDQHSSSLRTVYGKDSGALSYALNAHFDAFQGDQSCAMRTCGYVLKELYPTIETDHAQSFALMYQLTMVLKEGGYTAQAWSVFQKAVIQPFGESPYATLVRPVYKPISLLLALADGTSSCDDILYEGFKWASRTNNLRLRDPLNLLLGRLGCCGNLMSAEICYLLALKLSEKPDQILTEIQITWLLAQGKWFVSNGLSFLHNHGLKSAMTQLLRLQRKLDELGLKSVSIENGLFHFTSDGKELVVRILI